MEWNRSESLVLAAETCSHCKGSGTRKSNREESGPCKCVLRSVFRICYRRFRECANKDLDSSRVSLENSVTREPGGGWSRKNEEYVADFLAIVKRTLTEEEHKVFRYHFLLGADWKLCCRKMQLDKGLFFHQIYRIQQKLGQAFRELQPYGIYPLNEYFSSVRSHSNSKVVSIRSAKSGLSSLVPLQKAA